MPPPLRGAAERQAVSEQQLDTHCWLWLVADPERIRRDVVEMLVAEGTDVYISAATAWEIVIKHALGELSLPIPPAEYIPSRMAALGHLSLPIEQRHSLQVAGLPPHHKDPLDRTLVAQAQGDRSSRCFVRTRTSHHELA
ncbi:MULTISPECIES: type II toxin-antitoxin system VapC family toxin [Sorangium]|uniref:PIN domain-containing protein n=1 Tax=Sorangium cellulosum TaxID=56 RepID=A0A4P2QFJ9_SORCE|nr:type II toxin-antitoxin system VapC family toxin [Sorangium sp. Soce836]AUX28251.1 uncharacterized protein SOCE836_003190 [Sorangium cellulosum]